MTRLESPDVLTDGAWEVVRGILRWVPAEWAPPIRPARDLRLLVACPTCHASVAETCRATGRSDGYRPRRRPHKERLAPRLCICGALLAPRRHLCDPCRDQANRENKAAYMRRTRERADRSDAA